MHTIIWTIGRIAKSLLSDSEGDGPLAGADRETHGEASDFSLIKIIINIVLPRGR